MIFFLPKWERRPTDFSTDQHVAFAGRLVKRRALLPIDGRDAGYVDEKRLKGVCFEVPRRRIEGYLEVLKSGEPKTTVKIWECVRSDEEGGRTAAESFFKDVACPTAILATGDRLAIGIMEAARAHRIRIPEDMAIVGFDDIPAASLVSPQLTTLHQPMAEKGRQAISSLLNEKAPLRLKLPTKLLIRQSCGAKS